MSAAYPLDDYRDRRKLFTPGEFREMYESGLLEPDQRWELIEGEIVAMSPMKSPHMHYTMIMARLLSQAAGQSFLVASPGVVETSDLSQLQPDLLLLGSSADQYIEHLPSPEDIVVVIEVSDSTLDFDLSTKMRLYARAQMREYWVVDVRSARAIVHREPVGNAYRSVQTFVSPDTIAPVEAPEASVSLAALFALRPRESA